MTALGMGLLGLIFSALLVYLGVYAAVRVGARLSRPSPPRPHAPQRKGANMRHMERFQ